MPNKPRNILKPSVSRVKTQITALIIGSVMLAGASAHAIVPNDNIVQMRIDTRDLVNEKGVASVYKQMSRRAKIECATSTRSTISDMRVAKTCAADLLAEFVRDLDDQRMTSHHEKVTKH